MGWWRCRGRWLGFIPPFVWGESSAGRYGGVKHVEKTPTDKLDVEGGRGMVGLTGGHLMAEGRIKAQPPGRRHEGGPILGRHA